MATYSLRQEIKSLTQSQEHTNFRPLLKHSCRWRKAPYPQPPSHPQFLANQYVSWGYFAEGLGGL